MTKTTNQELFESTPIPKALISLSVPTVISSLVMVIYNLADTFFVGQLNDPVQNAAVTLAAPVLLAFNAINNLFGVGSSSMMSRALGKKDMETVKKSASFGFWCSVIGGLALSLGASLFLSPLLKLLGADSETFGATAEYMKWTVCFGAVPSILNVVLAYMVRSEGRTLHASIGTMSGCLLNIILDPIFIMDWGLGMGAAGAGLATCLSNCVACLYFFALLVIKKEETQIRFSLKHFRFRKAIVLGIFGVGLPAAIQNLLNVTGMTVLNNFTAALGSEAVSAMGIAQKINMVPLYISMGVSQGLMPLIGYNFASGNISRMKEAVKLTAKIFLGFMLCVTFFYFLFAGNLIWLFMKNEAIVSYGTHFLRGLCLGTPLLAIDFLAVGVFQATGMGKHAFCFAVLRKIILEIPALILLNLLFPPYGIAYAQFFAEFVLAVAAVIILVRLFHRLEKENKAR